MSGAKYLQSAQTVQFKRGFGAELGTASSFRSAENEQTSKVVRAYLKPVLGNRSRDVEKAVLDWEIPVLG